MTTGRGTPPPLPPPQPPAAAARAISDAARAAAHAWAQPMDPEEHNQALGQMHSVLRDLGIATRGLLRYQTTGHPSDPAAPDFSWLLATSAQLLLEASERLDGVLAAEGPRGLPYPDQPGAMLCQAARKAITAWREPAGTSAERDATIEGLIAGIGYLGAATRNLMTWAPRQRTIDLRAIDASLTGVTTCLSRAIAPPPAAERPDSAASNPSVGRPLMNEDQVTNGERAALALDAVTVYARPSSWQSASEDQFFFDFERDAELATDNDRLSALLNGLMHYAERRKLSFDAALASARQEHQHQRTTYIPGDAVLRIDRMLRAVDDRTPLIGEVIKAMPGRPSTYEVDFITASEWFTEPCLAPAPRFMTIQTEFGDLSSAHAARNCLRRVVESIEADFRKGHSPEPSAIRDLRTIVGELASWSGILRTELLRSFSHVITERDGWLVAGACTAHPVSLAAADIPAAPDTSVPTIKEATASCAVVIPLRQPDRPRRRGGR
jgi:hypothetical protein